MSWPSSAFLISYDGPGGWFDHVAPPQVDADGYGLRVPALLISPYALRRSGEPLRAGRHQRTEVHPGQLAAATADHPRRCRLEYRPAGSISPAHRDAAQLLPVAPVESGPPVGAVGAVYWTYGSAAAVIALMLIAAAVSPWIRRRLMLVGRGQHRLGRPRTRSIMSIRRVARGLAVAPQPWPSSPPVVRRQLRVASTTPSRDDERHRIARFRRRPSIRRPSGHPGGEHRPGAARNSVEHGRHHRWSRMQSGRASITQDRNLDRAHADPCRHHAGDRGSALRVLPMGRPTGSGAGLYAEPYASPCAPTTR